MKRYITLLAIFFCTLSLKAQDSQAVLQMIEQAGATITTIECEIENIRLKEGEERTKHGLFYFQNDSKLATFFENDDYAIFNGNKVKINFGILRGTFRTNRENIFNSLSDMLFCAIKGRCVQVAERNDYDYDLETKDDSYQVNFNSRKKTSRGLGYRKVVFVYGKDDYRLRSLITTDFKGTINIFSFSKLKYGCKIDSSKFNL